MNIAYFLIFYLNFIEKRTSRVNTKIQKELITGSSSIGANNRSEF